MSSDLVAAAADFARRQMGGEGSGHDFYHIERVRRMALHIARAEDADVLIVELAALLHDIDDYKVRGGDGTPTAAREFLTGQGADPAAIEHVCEIISDLSYKGAKVPTPMRTIEGRCVQDADRLDALGAIGIARCFVYTGHIGNQIHDPESEPHEHASFAEYRSRKGTSINHFYEKLLLLRDRMTTGTGRRIASERHAFMEAYLGRFFKEWGGEA